MARIAGVDIPNDKRVVIALTYIYGIGKSTSEKVLEETKIDENIRVKDLSEEQMKQSERPSTRSRSKGICEEKYS